MESDFSLSAARVDLTNFLKGWVRSRGFKRLGVDLGVGGKVGVADDNNPCKSGLSSGPLVYVTQGTPDRTI